MTPEYLAEKAFWWRGAWDDNLYYARRPGSASPASWTTTRPWRLALRGRVRLATLSPVDEDVLIRQMAREWRGITDIDAVVRDWHYQIESLQEQVRDLRVRGLWRSGGRTLLNALWVHHDEVILCRGLAWLLTPDGWHGLGPNVLRGLIKFLDLGSTGVERAQVVTEEQRGLTRADVIVRYASACILIEAKMWAGEQSHQADRLAREWIEDTPVLVFLTRDRALPVTAVETAGQWHPLAWHDVAEIIRTAIEDSLDPAPGAREFLQTLENYGGSRG